MLTLISSSVRTEVLTGSEQVASSATSSVVRLARRASPLREPVEVSAVWTFGVWVGVVGAGVMADVVMSGLDFARPRDPGLNYSPAVSSELIADVMAAAEPTF